MNTILYYLCFLCVINPINQFMKKLISLSLTFLLISLLTSCKNDSKIIASFGSMNEKLEESSAVTKVKNGVLEKQLVRKLKNDSVKFLPIHNRLTDAKVISNSFFTYLESVKDSIYNGTLAEDQTRTSYNNLTDSDYLDAYFFDAGKLTPAGKEFLMRIENYKKEYKSVLGKGYGTIATMVAVRFKTKELMDYSGNVTPWLNFKFENFPAMSSIFNITQMQSDVREIETELINSMLSGEFRKEFAMRNYTAIVRFDKGSYYPDERVSGKIVLGRFDKSAEPFDVVMNGHKLDEKYSVEGGVLIDFEAPSPGTHDLNGTFTVMYDGDPVVIDYASTYKVISRENIVEKIVIQKEIIEKPVYIDRPVKSQKPEKTTPTVAADAKTKEYYSNTKVKTVAKGTVEGTVNEANGDVSMIKTSLHQATIGTVDENGSRYYVTSFMVKVPGLLTVYVEGNKLSRDAIRSINKAKTGQEITFFQIKAVDKAGNRVGKVKSIKVKIKD